MALVCCNVLLIPKFNSPIVLFTWLFCTAITTICIYLIIIFIIINQQTMSLCSHNLYKSTGSYTCIQLSMCWLSPFSFFSFFVSFLFSFAKVIINNVLLLIISLTELHVGSNSVSNRTAVLVVKQIGLPLHSCLILLNTCTCMILDRIGLHSVLLK